MSDIPIEDLTEEEKEHLKEIRSYSGKGYIRGYCIKMVHVCPECGQAAGWEMMSICLACGHRIDPKDYRKLERQERWQKI